MTRLLVTMFAIISLGACTKSSNTTEEVTPPVVPTVSETATVQPATQVETSPDVEPVGTVGTKSTTSPDSGFVSKSQ